MPPCLPITGCAVDEKHGGVAGFARVDTVQVAPVYGVVEDFEIFVHLGIFLVVITVIGRPDLTRAEQSYTYHGACYYFVHEQEFRTGES